MTTPETTNEQTADNTATVQQASAAVPRQPAYPPFLLVAFLGVALMCGAVIYLVNSYIEKIEELQQQPSVVVIDVGIIQLAKKQELQQQLASYESVMREVDIFANDLQDMLNAYRDAGIVVINKNATVSTPDSLDVTKLVAERLSVRLPDQLR